MKTSKEIKSMISEEIQEVSNYLEEDKEYRTDLNDAFKEIIKRRMEHCFKDLEQNIYKAKKNPMGFIISWKNGHFSLPVYEALEAALNQNPHDWNSLIWEQILRQMFEEQNRDKYLFYYAIRNAIMSKMNRGE